MSLNKSMKDYRLTIFSGTSHPKLAEAICKYLNVEVGKLYVGRFPDGEIDIKVQTDVRGADVFIIQPTCPPVDQNLFELLALIDCLKRASAERITPVIPYYGYARKDRKDEGRVPITAKLVADLLTVAGCHRILTVDLHTPQIQGFFNIPVDHLFARTVFIPYLQKLQIPDLVIVSPDVGSVKQTRSYAKRLNSGFAVIDKRRIGPEEVATLELIGNVQGKNAIIVDDIISTGVTVSEACKAIRKNGAKDIYLCATHPVLCGDSLKLLKQCDAKEIIVGDTIPISEDKILSNMKIISLGHYLGEAIRRIHNSESVSHLFDPLS